MKYKQTHYFIDKNYFSGSKLT